MTPAAIALTIGWLSVVTLTSGLLLWELRQIRKDRLFIDEMGWNGPMHLVITRDLRSGMVRCSASVLFVVLGVCSLVYPGSPGTRIVATVAFVWVAVALLLNTIFDRRARHYVALAEGHDEDYLPSARRVAAKPTIKGRRPTKKETP